MADGLPIWFNDEEFTLFKNLGRELVETLTNQHFILYSISYGETSSNLYGESKHKVYSAQTKVIGRIQIVDSDIVEQGGVRRMAKGDMTAWVYDDHLVELGLSIKVGDFIGFEGKFYEIYDAGYNQDEINRKLGVDREYYHEIKAKVITDDIFKSIEGDFE